MRISRGFALAGVVTRVPLDTLRPVSQTPPLARHAMTDLSPVRAESSVALPRHRPGVRSFRASVWIGLSFKESLLQ